MKLIGTVRKSDVEGGHWILTTSKGERYQLVGALADLTDGMQAELTGDIDRNMMSFGMSGINFTVTAIAEAVDVKPKAKSAAKRKK
jgi:hypothetical protein